MLDINPVQPTTPVVIGGVTYSLLFDFEAIALAERITSRSLLAGMRQQADETLTISFVGDMLYACLHAKHPKITYSKAKALVTRKTMVHIWGAIMRAWDAGLAEPDPDKVVEGADPTPDQRSNQLRWLDLWANARYDLHLSEAEFWHLTGRQLSALSRRRRQHDDREQILVGILASTTANFSMCHPKEPLTPADFMPRRGKPEPPMTEDEIAESVARQLAFCPRTPIEE